MLTSDEAADALADAEVQACLRAPLMEAKQILNACLEADIPALLDRGECCSKDGGGCGCAPKIELLVRPEDAPRVAALMQDRWRAMAEEEGLLDEDGRFVHAAADTAGAAEGEHAPCPACGNAGALVAGACPGCGLQLE